MKTLLKKWLFEGSRIAFLRILVKLGKQGRAHQYAIHKYCHYTDDTFMGKEEYYLAHNLHD